MLNRIIEIIESENLSHASFADEIGVQRSSISHILNKRNNPSLDFVIKTLQRFTLINPEWLILGTGEMYKNNEDNNDIGATIVESGLPQDLFSSLSHNEDKIEEREIFDLPMEEPVNEGVIRQKTDRYVSQILIFYSDSTYGVFKAGK